MSNIPQAVTQAAKSQGFNKVSYKGEYEGSSVYSVGCVRDDGQVVPTGLPTIILFKNNNAKMICGMESFDILDTFD